jgi:hypothetical protein
VLKNHLKKTFSDIHLRWKSHATSAFWTRNKALSSIFCVLFFHKLLTRKTAFSHFLHAFILKHAMSVANRVVKEHAIFTVHIYKPLKFLKNLQKARSTGKFSRNLKLNFVLYKNLRNQLPNYVWVETVTYLRSFGKKMTEKI